MSTAVGNGGLLLDTIETTHSKENKPKSLSIKGFEEKNEKKVYTDSKGFWEQVNEINSTTIKEFEYYKNLSMETAGILLYHDSILADRAEKIYNCGTILEFDLATKKLVSANFCRERLCATCQRRRSLKVASEFGEVVDFLKDYEFLHLVLTVPNCCGADLEDTVKMLYKNSSAFFKLDEVKKAFSGAVRCLEVTYNNHGNISTVGDDETGEQLYLTRNYWHPHLHCLVAVKHSYFHSRYYLSFEKIQKLWTSVNSSDVPLQVFVKKITDEKGIAEVAKYCVKPLELTVTAEERKNVLEVLHSTLYGRRLIQTYGVFREACRQLKLNFNTDEEMGGEFDIGSFYRYTYNYQRRQFEMRGDLTIFRKLNRCDE